LWEQGALRSPKSLTGKGKNYVFQGASCLLRKPRGRHNLPAFSGNGQLESNKKGEMNDEK
jgi:hypothetical protein